MKLNLWRWLVSPQYRKHRWAAKHLCEYRGHFEWVLRRKWRRMIDRMYSRTLKRMLEDTDLYHTELKYGDIFKIPKNRV